MIDPLSVLYENINKDDIIFEYPDIEYPFTKESIMKTEYPIIYANENHQSTRDIEKYVYCTKLTTYKEYIWVIDQMQGRDERDEKTKLLLPSLVCINIHDNSIQTLAWNIGDEHHRDESERDPKTGKPLPQYLNDTNTYQDRQWWVKNRQHNLYGPCYIKKNIVLDTILQKGYSIEDEPMSKEEWEKDPRVIRANNIQKLDNPNIKDDDFLRTFGDIL